MSRGEKLIATLVIFLLVFCCLLYWRQSELRKSQGELDRKWGRNPLVEPAPNSTNTAPRK